MINNFTLKSILFLLVFVPSIIFAQNSYTYKLVFSANSSKQSDALNVLLKSYSDQGSPIYNEEENFVIINSSTPINKNNLIGKLNKLNVILSSFEEMPKVIITDDKVKSITPVNTKEVQDKAAKAKEQVSEQQNKKAPAEKNKRY